MDRQMEFRGYATVLLKFLTNQDAYEKWCVDNNTDEFFRMGSDIDPFRCSFAYLYARPVRTIDISTQRFDKGYDTPNDNKMLFNLIEAETVSYAKKDDL